MISFIEREAIHSMYDNIQITETSKERFSEQI